MDTAALVASISLTVSPWLEAGSHWPVRLVAGVLDGIGFAAVVLVIAMAVSGLVALVLVI